MYFDHIHSSHICRLHPLLPTHPTLSAASIKSSVYWPTGLGCVACPGMYVVDLPRTASLENTGSLSPSSFLASGRVSCLSSSLHTGFLPAWACAGFVYAFISAVGSVCNCHVVAGKLSLRSSMVCGSYSFLPPLPWRSPSPAERGVIFMSHLGLSTLVS